MGKANVREGTIDAALAISEWPRDLDLLIVDLGGAADPVADAAALKTAVPGGCIVIGVGRINDVALYRDLLAVGFNDYLAMPFAEGAMGRAVERAPRAARPHRRRDGARTSRARKDAKPRTLSVIGARGGVGTTTAAVTIAAMLGARLQGRGAADRLRPALRLAHAGARPRGDRRPARGARPARPHRRAVHPAGRAEEERVPLRHGRRGGRRPAASRRGRTRPATSCASVHRRFRWIVADVPRGDPVIQRQVIEASTDILLITDLSLPGVRDAMRLQQLVHDAGARRPASASPPAARVDARRSAVKVADVERTLKRKVDCQIPADPGARLAAVNFGKPLSEAAPEQRHRQGPAAARCHASTLPRDGGGNVEKAASLLGRLGQGMKKK